MSKPIHIFKAGTFRAMDGRTLAFTEADLRASAAAYSPAVHEAPIVVGHPLADAPAYGWVKSVAFSDADGLTASPDQVEPAFAELVRAGRFKKISASFYEPHAPNNPAPGVWYLKHVGFLGAQPPALKGLRSVQFAANEAGVVEFSEWDDAENAGLWRRMREWILGKFGQDEADQVVPGYLVQSLEASARDEIQKAQQEANPPAAAAFSDPVSQPKEASVTPEQAAALEAENAALRQEKAARDAADRAAATAAAHQANVAFCEGLVAQGRLLPAARDVLVATLDHVNAAGSVEFGEGDARQPLGDAFKAFLRQLPEQASFAEFATAANAAGHGAGTVSFAAPPGYQVDAVGLGQLAKARAYQAEHKVSFIEAVAAVQA